MRSRAVLVRDVNGNTLGILEDVLPDSDALSFEGEWAESGTLVITVEDHRAPEEEERARIARNRAKPDVDDWYATHYGRPVA